MSKRNIIFFHAESWDGRMLGSLGHPALKNATPNIDRLAESGALFENTYCSHPICCPSRANLWSGRYTHNCESWNNYKGLESRMWSLLDQLPETHNLATFGKLDYRSGGHTVVARLSAWLGASGVDKPVYDKDKSQCFTVDDSNDYRCHVGDWDKVDQAITFLEEQTQSEDDKPFFLYISSGLVHAAFKTNQYWLDKIPADAVDLPAMDHTDHPCRQHQRMSKAWRYGYDDETVRQVRRIYFAMCAEADAMVGAVYDAMQRLGMADDTYFVFSSDHGELALEHQDWYKMSLYEGAVRVPLVMTGPDITPARIPNLVSLVDLCPTLIEMAGLPLPRDLDGETLIPLACGQTADSRNTAYACFTGTTLNTTAYMLRKERWKYVVFVGYPAQLFDMEKDPGELNDVSDNYPDIVATLDADLRAMVDYEQTHQDVMAYNKNAFRQWQRQAKRGLFEDNSYSLQGNPSRNYWEIMDNCFTGYDEDDEKTVNAWLASKG